MFCEKCGRELMDGAEFCCYCGAAIKKEDNSEKSEPSLSAASDNGMDAGEGKQTGEGNGRKKESKKKGRGGIIAVTIVLTAVLAVGMACLAYFTSDTYRCKKNLRLAEKLFEEEEYEEALACYEEVLEIDPSRGEAYLKSVEIYVLQGDGREAVRTLKKGLRKADKDYEDELNDILEETYRLAISCCLSEGDYDTAVGYCQEAKIDPREYARDFTELSPEEIGNQFVYVDLTDNFGCFMEEYTRNSDVTNTEALYYVIWTGDDDVTDWCYMAIKVPADYEEQMEAMYNGDKTPIYFCGGIREFDEEENFYFEDYFKSADFSDDDIREGTIPYYIDACY